MDIQQKGHLGAAPKSGMSWIDRRLMQKFLRHAFAGGLFVVVLACGLLGPPARAADIPTDPHGFTAYVSAQFKKALPHTKIETLGDLKLQMTASGRDWSVSLEEVYGACRRNRPSCGESIATYVANTSGLLNAPHPSLDLTSLRIVLRPTEYVDSLRNKPFGLDPVATPVEGDFWMVVARDLPTSIQPLDKKALEIMHLSPDEAFAVAKKNMSESMRDAIQQVLQKPLDEIGVMAGDDYISSLFAFPEIWAPLAKALDGNLLVAVPSTDMIVYMDARKPQAVEVVAGTAQIVMKSSEKVFSADVFRWSPDGWIPISPDGDKRP